MRDQGPGGVIINMSWDPSPSAWRGKIRCCTRWPRARWMSFSKSFAREVAPRHPSYILAPGFIETAFGKDADPPLPPDLGDRARRR